MLPPVATIEGTPTASIGGGPMTIKIRWTDDEGVDTSTLGNNDIAVTRPGNTVFATFVSYTGTPKDLVATYQIPAPPSPGWDFTYSGTYQVQSTDGEVSDIGRRSVAADVIGTFNMTFAPPLVSNPLVINGTDGNDDILVQSGGGVLSVYVNSVPTNYRSTDVTGIQINGLDGIDVLNARGVTVPVTINGGLGNDWILGGAGNDLLTGDAGNDTINGGPGNDTIDGGMGSDSLIGGGGTDVFLGTPTDISLSANSVAENQPAGTVVGTLTSTDPDAWETFTYAMVSGTGSADNASFQIAGNQLKAAASLNYETRSSYSIRIRTTDADGLFTEKVFAINVTDVNEAPTAMQVSPGSVAENLPVGTTVGNLSVTDPDIGETYSYEILPGVDQSAFTIAGNQLKTAISLDYEVKRNYAITVRVHDGSNTYDQSLTISVNNVNEAPTGVTLSNTSVAENLAAGATVGSLSTIDPDTIGSYTYEILPGGDATAFSIAGSQLKTAASFNYETKNTYAITVRVHDGTNTLDQPLMISVTDVNEPPTDIALSTSSVPENKPSGTVVGMLWTTDPDSGESTSYEILPGGDAASFAIVGNQLTTAVVCDYESKATYSITVRAHDGINTLDKPFTITVTDLPEFGLQHGRIAKVTVPDADGDLVTYSLAGGGSGAIQPDHSITLTGTTLKSVLSISVKKAASGDGYCSIPGISADGLLKGISAAKTFAGGQIDINTSTVSVGTAKVAISLAGVINGSIITHGVPIASLKLLNWQDTDGTADQVVAPSIGTITVSGRKDNPKTPANELLAGDWDADVSTGPIKSITAAGTIRGDITASGAITSIKATGGITGAIRSGKDAKGTGIGSITVGGTVQGAKIVTSGSIGKMTVAALMDSDILVGVATDFAGQFAGHSDFTNPAAKLTSLTVGGRKLPKGATHSAYVSGVQLSAPSIGTLKLANVSDDPDAIHGHLLSDTGALTITALNPLTAGVSVLTPGTWKPTTAGRPDVFDVV